MDQGSPTNENRIENKIKMWVNACRTAPFFSFLPPGNVFTRPGLALFQAGQPRWPTPQKTKKKNCLLFSSFLSCIRFSRCDEPLWKRFLFSRTKRKKEGKKLVFWRSRNIPAIPSHKTKELCGLAGQEEKKTTLAWSSSREKSQEACHPSKWAAPPSTQSEIFFHYVSFYLI